MVSLREKTFPKMITISILGVFFVTFRALYVGNKQKMRKSVKLKCFYILFAFRKTGRKTKQDGRLAPAYFSPNYKYFDQFLQTTVLILVFKEFLQT